MNLSLLLSQIRNHNLWVKMLKSDISPLCTEPLQHIIVIKQYGWPTNQPTFFNGKKTNSTNPVNWKQFNCYHFNFRLQEGHISTHKFPPTKSCFAVPVFIHVHLSIPILFWIWNPYLPRLLKFRLSKHIFPILSYQ